MAVCKRSKVLKGELINVEFDGCGVFERGLGGLTQIYADLKGLTQMGDEGSWWKKGWLFGCFLRTKSEKMS